MRRFSPSSFAAGAIVATMLVSVPAVASVRAAQTDQAPAAMDATAPLLSVAPQKFVLGASIDASTTATWDCGAKFWHDNVPTQVPWTASDGISGLSGFDVYNDDMWEGGLQLENTQQTSLSLTGNDYDGSCGGGYRSTRWWVTAKDHRGNSAVSNRSTSDWIMVWQETGLIPSPYVSALPVAKSSGWSVSKCTCSDAGATMFSTTGGSSVTYTVTTVPGQTFAVAMGQNTNRGNASISVDGGPGTVVNTYSAIPKHRVILWQQTLGAGTHKIKITNSGTPGRSRIDIDAVLSTRGESAN